MKGNIFLKLNPKARENLFYINTMKHPIRKMKEITELKSIYKKTKIDFGDFTNNRKDIYNTLKKIILKTSDGFEFAKELYKSNIKIEKKSIIKDNKIILICLVKNDLRRIKEFYEHYKKIGVENFVFIDNNSDDGTFGFLFNLEDVTIFRIEEKYSTIRRQAWISKVINYFGFNKWYIVVDSDEFLVYNDCETKNIEKLIEKIDKQKRTRALMIDMYADKKILDDENSDRKIEEEYVYFDANTYHKGKHKCFELIQGGVRERIFGKYDNISPFLIKYPIFFYEKGDMQYNSHFSFPFYKNFNIEINTCLLHYKFLPEDLEKIKIRAKEKNYAMGSKEYNAYLKAYIENPKLNFKYDKSEMYKNSRDLEKIKLIDFIDWSNEKNG